MQTETTCGLDKRLIERHRPIESAVMFQRWSELLFLHWRYSPEDLLAHIPAELELDLFDGSAWVGVVPFSMQSVRPRFLPAVSGISDFPELNLRTYVLDKQGGPGVWFFSLDTPKSFSNWIARKFFHLNYRKARISVSSLNGSNQYLSELKMDSAWDEAQSYNWSREGQPFLAEPGSLEFFLTERYRLFAYNYRKAQLYTGKVHHVPYPLQQVNLSQHSKRLFSSNKLLPPKGELASVLASSGVDVEVFPLRRVLS